MYQPHESPVTDKKELAYHERPEYIGEKLLTTKIGPIRVSLMVFLSWSGGRKTLPAVIPKKRAK